MDTRFTRQTILVAAMLGALVSACSKGGTKDVTTEFDMLEVSDSASSAFLAVIAPGSNGSVEILYSIGFQSPESISITSADIPNRPDAQIVILTYAEPGLVGTTPTFLPPDSSADPLVAIAPVKIFRSDLLGNHRFEPLSAQDSSADTINTFSQMVYVDRSLLQPSATPTPITPPNDPTLLTAHTRSATKIELGWNDNSNDELGFRIERATSSSGPFVEIQSTAPDVRTFLDSGLVFPATYFYRVRAYNSAGDSGYSPIASALADHGSYQWSKKFDAGFIQVSGARADASGNVFIAGVFQGTVDLGGGAITNSGAGEIFVAKYSASGSYLWSRVMAGNSGGADIPNGLAVDSAGNVILGGTFDATVNFGGGAMTAAGSGGGSDVFLAKYSGSTGAHLWSKRFGDASYDTGKAVATAPNGDVIFTGIFPGTIDFGDGPNTACGSFDSFVLRFTSAGAFVSVSQICSPGDEQAFGVATDASGNAIVTGYFTNSFCKPSGQSFVCYTSNGGADMFLAKYNSAGSMLMGTAIGGTGNDYGESVAVDANGDAFVTGEFSQTVNFGGGNVSGANGELYLAKYSGSNGSYIWSKAFLSSDASGNNVSFGVSVDSAGNVAIGGSIKATVDFGGGPLSKIGTTNLYDIFVAEFTGTGNHIWSKRLYGDGLDRAHSVAFDNSDNILLAGEIANGVDFGGGMATVSGSIAGFVVKYGP